MNIILVDVKTAVVDAWIEVFGRLDDNMSIEHGSIFDVECDAIVSPANSFGFMDGGIDLHISEYFGWHIQEELQKHIKSTPMGEILVGDAVLVETGDARVPTLISAPTMRVPLEIQETVNVYLTMKAILSVTKNVEGINTIAIPGLGTGCGQVNPHSSARQMRRAYDEMKGARDYPRTWVEAQNKHYVIRKL